MSISTRRLSNKLSSLGRNDQTSSEQGREMSSMPGHNREFSPLKIQQPKFLSSSKRWNQTSVATIKAQPTAHSERQLTLEKQASETSSYRVNQVHHHLLFSKEYQVTSTLRTQKIQPVRGTTISQKTRTMSLEGSYKKWRKTPYMKKRMSTLALCTMPRTRVSIRDARTASRAQLKVRTFLKSSNIW